MVSTTAPPVKKKETSANGQFQQTIDLQKQSHGGILDMMKIPFVTKLSFAPLLRHWQEKLDSKDVAERLLAQEIMRRVEQSPELWEPLEDAAELDRHKEVVELLLAGLFPLSLRHEQLGKAAKPFDMNAFFCTPALSDMMKNCGVSVKVEKTSESFFATIPIRACGFILNHCYGQQLDVDPLVIFTIQPGGSDISYHLKSELNIRFSEVVPVKPLKELSQEHINHLLSNIYDLDAWTNAIPPDAFEIHGVAGINLIDVTEEETLSRLRFQLLEKDAVVRKENVAGLERLLKSYFDMPELRLGIMAIDYPGNRQNEFKYKIRHCFLSDWHECLLDPENANSVYDKACKYKETLLVEDLAKLKSRTPIEQGMLDRGIRSYLVSPLLSKDGDIIGVVELGTPQPFQLNSFAELKFKDILPLFSTAVERSREETDNQIEAIIREKFTAIHPSVDWRFVQAAFNYLDRHETEGKKAAVEPIAFEDVFPLYAQADIVGSSTTRNKAIQEDFFQNLELIKEVLQTAIQRVDFPLLHQYLLETEHRMAELGQELKSSDESLIIDFIQREIHPLLEEVAAKDASLSLTIDLYKKQLDPEFGVVYRKRKDYEESVNRINNAISEYLEHEEERTQRMVSHYFEKYKTDGVQFELYAGQSLLREGKFSLLHLRNLRLWQLIALCDITRDMDKLKGELSMPLSTAQLVFVYGQPISIRFRMDDKRFDVDGAYNIRYEIIKKRIDKATVTTPEGKRERLTQANKIAIVYASEKDKHEYMEHLTYLIRQGYIDREIEDLDLDHLQGVQGLKALRVKVR
jgi:hypothetical protein